MALVVGVSQTLQRWTEGATYIRHGDHQVGHCPTFLVIYIALVPLRCWLTSSTYILQNTTVFQQPKRPAGEMFKEKSLTGVKYRKIATLTKPRKTTKMTCLYFLHASTMHHNIQVGRTFLTKKSYKNLTHRGFRAQRFYLNLLPVLGYLDHLTDLDEPDKPVTSVFLISQHRKSYKPSKNGAICAWAYLLCAQRF